MSDYAYDASAQELYLSAGTPRSRLNTLEGAVANKSNKVDLTNISITGSTNNTGATISSGTFFYKDGDLVQAKVDIANGATLTLNTNYELVTAGGLNKLNASKLNIDFSVGTGTAITLPYTPTQNGVLSATGKASTETNSYLSISNGVSTQACFIPHTGWTGSLQVLVFKGKTISHSNANLTTASYTFYPFEN